MMSAYFDIRSAKTGEARPDFEALFDRSPDASLLVEGASGLIVGANDAVRRVLGMEPQALVGAPLDRIMAPQDSNATLDAHDAVFVVPVQCAGGDVREVDVTICTVAWAEVPLLLITLRDTRERQRDEAAAAIRDREVAQSDRLISVGALAAGIAHDFNNILTHIVCNAGMARDDLPAGIGAHVYLDQIDSASQSAAELCRQMLAYAGKSSFGMMLTDLGRLVRREEPELRKLVPPDVRLTITVPEERIFAQADASQIQQTLRNLVKNGAEALAGREGNIWISVGRTKVQSEDPEATTVLGDLGAQDCVCLEVVDDGCGMTTETRRRMFDPFFTTKFQGRGLGLAAVWGIARRHQAQLRVRSQPERGTSLRLLFPPPVQATPLERLATQGRAAAVMVLDPHAESRASTASLIRALGIACLPVKNVDEARGAWRAQGDCIGALIIDAAAFRHDPAAADKWAKLRPAAPTFCIVDMESAFDHLELLQPREVLVRPFNLESLSRVLQKHAPQLVAPSSAARS